MTSKEKKEEREKFEMLVKMEQSRNNCSYIEAYKAVIAERVQSIENNQDTIDYMREIYYLFPEHREIIVDIGKMTKEIVKKDKEILDIL